jgi:hypothetical protein
MVRRITELEEAIQNLEQEAEKNPGMCHRICMGVVEGLAAIAVIAVSGYVALSHMEWSQ